MLSLPDDALIALDPTGVAARRHAAFAPAAARERIAAAGLVAVCRCSAAYPARCASSPTRRPSSTSRAIPARCDGAGSVAVVGARRGTPYGLEVARSLGRDISAAGMTVVSGLALGVDSAAHVGALSARAAPSHIEAPSTAFAPVRDAVLRGGAPGARRRDDALAPGGRPGRAMRPATGGPGALGRGLFAGAPGAL